MKTILFPTDFSNCATNAIPHAVGLCKVWNAKLLLYHSLLMPPYRMMPDGAEHASENFIREAHNRINNIKSELLSQYPRLVIDTELEVGVAVENIITQALKHSVDMIVMGTKGASGLQELLTGTHAAAILEKAQCPVYIIPQSSKHKSIKKIAYATNFGDSDFVAISILIELAEAYDAEIHVVHVSEYMQSNTYREDFDSHFRNELKKHDGLAQYKIFTHHLIGGNTDYELEQFIAEHEMQLLSMSTRKRGVLSKLFGSSLSKKMAYHTHVPLLVFHQ